MATSALNTQFLPKDMAVRKDLDIRSGDTVRVYVKIQDKGKTRIQLFEGLVLARKHGNENGGTFTVRKITNGVGVERVFPLYSPMLEKIEVVRRVRTRRSKLYFIRTKVARQIRRKMRNFIDFSATSEDLVVPADEMLDEVIEEKTDTPTIETETQTSDSNTSQEEASKDEKKEEAPVTETPKEEEKPTEIEAPAGEDKKEPEAETPTEETKEETPAE